MATSTPTQSQLLLPVLEVLQDHGGLAKTATVCAEVADRLAVPDGVTTARIPCGAAGHIKPWDRSVRWAMQRARLDGLARPIGASCWVITGKGREALRTSRSGLIVTLFVTDRGVAIWAACADAIGAVDDSSVQLLLTSPPWRPSGGCRPTITPTPTTARSSPPTRPPCKPGSPRAARPGRTAPAVTTWSPAALARTTAERSRQTASRPATGRARVATLRPAGHPDSLSTPRGSPPPCPSSSSSLCTRPDDLVLVPFDESGTTAEAAERLGRRWITSDTCLDYLLGAASRFTNTPGSASSLGLPRETYAHPDLRETETVTVATLSSPNRCSVTSTHLPELPNSV
jgi:hypothetical protein